MPSYVMHHYFAELVREAAPSVIAGVCKAEPDAYFWGCQGPDPFFYRADRIRIARLGGAMHRGGIAEAFIALAGRAGDSPAAQAYLFGFCTHYALDRTVHPYIEDQGRRLMTHYGIGSSAAHKLCETDLDTAVLLKQGKDPVSEPAYRLLDVQTETCTAAAEMLAAAGNAAGGRVTAREALGALRAMRRVYRLLQERRWVERPLRCGERLLRAPGELSVMIRRAQLLPEDSLNRAHRVWTDWEGRPHTEDFQFLTETKALLFALDLQQAACAVCRRGRAFPRELFLRDYSGRRAAVSKEP